MQAHQQVRSLALIAGLLPAFATTGVLAEVTVAHSFVPTPNGASPASGLVQGRDGYFYGTTRRGGSHDLGTVFRLSAGGVLTVLHSFEGSDGSYPIGGLAQGGAGDDAFYGTTSEGGPASAGTVFKISASGTLTSLHEFSGSDGAKPYASLLLGADGKLYGTTYSGGVSGKGTIFTITAAGALTTIDSFDGTRGEAPQGGLIRGADGNLYGTTALGGTNGLGTIYELIAGATVVPLYSFAGGAEGSSPFGELLQGTDGSFYGVTAGRTLADKGTVFKFTAAAPPLRVGSLTTLHSFKGWPTDGEKPYASLVAGNDGSLYGTTEGGGSGSRGTVYRITTAGTLTVLVSFTSVDGAWPAGSLVRVGDDFYGTTMAGGRSFQGTAFKVSSAGALTSLYSFNMTEGAQPEGDPVFGADGALYGTTYFGGLSNVGSVYRLDSDGSFATLHSLADKGTPGRYPFAGLSLAADGSLYGAAQIIGDQSDPDNGLIFRLAPDRSFAVVHAFVGRDGSEPDGTLVEGPDGALYGTTYSGGASWFGTVFKVDPDGYVTTLHAFQGPDGVNPIAGLILGDDGDFYGATYGGGSGNAGTVFRITPSGAFTTLHQFSGADGDGPFAALTQGADGAFYGATDRGGEAGSGTLYRVTSSGDFTSLHSFNDDDGALPDALASGSDGNLWGSAYSGGAEGKGTVFRMTPQGGFTLLHSFTGPEGESPYSRLVQGPDGNFYGTTDYGGTADSGVIYRVPGPPRIPSGLDAVATGNEASLEWQPAGGATGYKVYMGTSADALQFQQTTSALNATITDLQPGIRYYWRITAFNAVGESLPSRTVDATTAPAQLILERNTGATAPEGGVAYLSESLLATYASRTPAQIVYHVTRPPQFGALSVSDGSAGAAQNTEFSQAAIGNGWVVYRHDGGEETQDSFDFTVQDPASGSSIGPFTFHIAITPVNDPPRAVNDATGVPEDGSVLIDVLANDSDAEGTTLSISALGTPSAGGTVMVMGNQVQYSPARHFHGSETFSYTVTDGVATSTATVSVTVLAVNHAPQATNDVASAAEDGGSYLISVLANDTDADGDALAVTQVGAPDHGGQAVISMGGAAVTYTPAPDFNGTETFTYVVSDGPSAVTATVTVTVAPANDTPTAVNDAAAAVSDGTTLVIDVLANDADVDGDALHVDSVGTPSAGGTVTIAPDGAAIRYTPSPNFSGVETFPYAAGDGSTTTVATVTVTVSAPPGSPASQSGGGGGGSWGGMSSALFLLAALRRRRE